MLRRLPACLPLVTLFALALLVPPCAATQSASERFDLRGKVINSVTGEPVNGALVQLSANETQFSQSDGSFVFTDLPRGQLSVVARKPGFFNEQDLGYLREAFDQHGNYSTAIAVGPGLDFEHLLFRLHPQAVIHGRVTDEHGDPARRAVVQLFLNSNAQASRANFVQTQTQTDDLGEYRFAHLPAGKYYVVVQAQPWYVQIGLARRGAREPSASTSFRYPTIGSNLNPLLDVVYPVTFYPGMLNDRSASELNLTAGGQEEANIQLQPVPSVHVILTNAPVDPNDPNDPGVSANRKIFGSFAVGFPTVSGQVSPGEFELAGLPPGEVTFTIGAGRNRPEGTRTFNANVAGSDTLDASVAGPILPVGCRNS